MTNTKRNRGAGSRPLGRAWLAAAILALPLVGLTGCDLDDILDVPDPDVVLPIDMEGPLTLPAVRANAIGDFTFAYSGSGTNVEAQITMSGLFSDEFIHSGTFDTRESLDRRIADVTNPHVLSTFHNLHRARASAERAIRLFGDHDPGVTHHAEAMNLAAYTYIFFGSNYCSGIPFSEITPGGVLEFGDPLTTVQVFTTALGLFEDAEAVASDAGSAAMESMARLGQAHALLMLGEFEQAAAVASQVPTTFEYVLFHSESSARQNNGVWTLSNNFGRWSVAEQEGGNGLPYRTDGNVDGDVQDPRIPNLHIGLSQRTALRPNEHWGQLKYPTRTSSTILATGIEARLIEAEAALQDGVAGVPAFLGFHNDLRATVGLDPLDAVEVAAMTQDERVDLHFQERAYWLWLTGRRLGDLRRLLWDYGRSQDEVFPVGNHHRAGAPYGTHTQLPVPFDEQNNPNFEQCFTRDDEAGRHG